MAEQGKREHKDPTGWSAFWPSMVLVGIALIAFLGIGLATTHATWIVALAFVALVGGTIAVVAYMEWVTQTPEEDWLHGAPTTGDGKASHSGLSIHDLPTDNPSRADLIEARA